MAERNAFGELTAFLSENGASYEVLEHETPCVFSEATGAVTGIPPEQAVKALLYRDWDNYLLVALPARRSVSISRLWEIVGARDLRLTPPEEVERIMGCDVDLCHPIGRLAGIRTIADPILAESELISFSTGDPYRTMTMEYPEYVRVAQPDIADTFIVP